MQLNISHVRYTYPGAAETAVNDVTVVFREGWTGLVGNNGCGKTTLALIAAGILTPDAGKMCIRDRTWASPLGRHGHLRPLRQGAPEYPIIYMEGPGGPRKGRAHAINGTGVPCKRKNAAGATPRQDCRIIGGLLDTPRDR